MFPVDLVTLLRLGSCAARLYRSTGITVFASVRLASRRSLSRTLASLTPKTRQSCSISSGVMVPTCIHQLVFSRLFCNDHMTHPLLGLYNWIYAIRMVCFSWAGNTAGLAENVSANSFQVRARFWVYHPPYFVSTHTPTYLEQIYQCMFSKLQTACPNWGHRVLTRMSSGKARATEAFLLKGL